MIRWRQFYHVKGAIAKIDGAGYVSYVLTLNGYVITIFGQRHGPFNTVDQKWCRDYIEDNAIKQLNGALATLEATK